MKDTLQFVSLSRYLLNRRISKSHFSYIWSSSYNLLIWTRFYDHKISFDKRRNKTDRPVKLSQILLITSNNTMIRLHSSTCFTCNHAYPPYLSDHFIQIYLRNWSRCLNEASSSPRILHDLELILDLPHRSSSTSVQSSSKRAVRYIDL